MAQPRRADILRLTLLLLVIGLFGLGDYCNGCNPNAPTRVAWGECNNPTYIGGKYSDDCAALASNNKCTSYAFDGQACYCCK